MSTVIYIAQQHNKRKKKKKYEAHELVDFAWNVPYTVYTMNENRN